MAIYHTQIFFKFPLNVSVQIGDFAYFSVTTPSSQSQSGAATPGTQFLINNGNMSEVGEIIDIFHGPTSLAGYISASSIVCRFDCTMVPDTCAAHIPRIGDFIMFSKDNAANMTSILGYYAEVEMANDSNEKAKLFAVSSSVIESSK
jgi:hypothetical protein